MPRKHPGGPFIESLEEYAERLEREADRDAREYAEEKARKEREHAMFDMSIDELDTLVEQLTTHPDEVDPLMYAQGWISDAQEMMRLGMVDAARCCLNRVKFLLDALRQKR